MNSPPHFNHNYHQYLTSSLFLPSRKYFSAYLISQCLAPLTTSSHSTLDLHDHILYWIILSLQLFISLVDTLLCLMSICEILKYLIIFFLLILHCCVCVCLIMYDSLRPHGLYCARLFCLWNLPGENTGEGCHFLLQGIFLTQGSNLHLFCLLHCQVDSLRLCHLGSPLLVTVFIIC